MSCDAKVQVDTVLFGKGRNDFFYWHCTECGAISQKQWASMYDASLAARAHNRRNK